MIYKVKLPTKIWDAACIEKPLYLSHVAFDSEEGCWYAANGLILVKVPVSQEDDASFPPFSFVVDANFFRFCGYLDMPIYIRIDENYKNFAYAEVGGMEVFVRIAGGKTPSPNKIIRKCKSILADYRSTHRKKRGQIALNAKLLSDLDSALREDGQSPGLILTFFDDGGPIEVRTLSENDSVGLVMPMNIPNSDLLV